MRADRPAFAWARGLGGGAVRLGVALASVLALTIAGFVFFLRDTPPVAAAVHHDETVGMDALLEATLQMSRDCITVRADGETWLPIFPSDSVRLRHDALLYNGDEYRAGDTIALPGGEVPVAPQGARVPKDCPSGPFWQVAP